MDTETLKSFGLNEEQIKSVMGEYGKVINPLKQEKTQLEQERDALKTQVDDVTNKLTDAQKTAEKGSDLEKQITDLQTQLADSKTEADKQLNATKKTYEISSALREAGARSEKAVLAFIDQDKVNFDDNGKLIGLSEQLDAVKKDNDYLFATAEPEGAEPGKPRISTGGNPNPDTGNGGETLTSRIAARLSGGK